MTTASIETTTPDSRSDARFLGALLLGIAATLSAGAGLWCLGMTGYVWADGQLWGSSSWSDEADFGTAVAVVLFGVWALLLLVTVIIALLGARRARDRDRHALVTMAVVMPAVSIVLILLVAPILLGQGGAQLIPLDELT